jgi:hypothetical protein
MDYPNVPWQIAAAMSGKYATLNELQTIYSVEDVYLFLEIMTVDRHNRKLMTPDASH